MVSARQGSSSLSQQKTHRLTQGHKVGRMVISPQMLGDSHSLILAIPLSTHSHMCGMSVWSTKDLSFDWLFFLRSGLQKLL